MTPAHLCHQWAGEMAKFAPELVVRLVTTEAELRFADANGAGSWRRKGLRGLPRGAPSWTWSS